MAILHGKQELLCDKTIIETMVSSERGMYPIAISIIESLGRIFVESCTLPTELPGFDCFVMGLDI